MWSLYTCGQSSNIAFLTIKWLVTVEFLLNLDQNGFSLYKIGHIPPRNGLGYYWAEQLKVGNSGTRFPARLAMWQTVSTYHFPGYGSQTVLVWRLSLSLSWDWMVCRLLVCSLYGPHLYGLPTVHFADCIIICRLNDKQTVWATTEYVVCILFNLQGLYTADCMVCSLNGPKTLRFAVCRMFTS